MTGNSSRPGINARQGYGVRYALTAGGPCEVRASSPAMLWPQFSVVAVKILIPATRMAGYYASWLSAAVK
jgi:hypothetical protein